MAKATDTTEFNLQKTLKAGVGAADLAVEAVREYVAEARKVAQQRIEAAREDAQKAISTAQESVRSIELQPRALRSQATTVVSTRVEELSREAKARREAVEKRVAELQADALQLVSANVDAATGTYQSLVERGATVVNRFRKETAAVADPGPVKKDTGETTTARRTRVAKAPATKAPATKAAATKAPATKATVKKTPVKRTVKKAPAKKVVTTS